MGFLRTHGPWFKNVNTGTTRSRIKELVPID